MTEVRATASGRGRHKDAVDRTARSVKSASRVFVLLEAFEQVRRPMRVGELVEYLDMPQSSVSMLLKTLTAEGYIDFDAESRSYCPSLRIAALCEWVTRIPHRSHSITTSLSCLASETGETVLLARIEGIALQYVNIVSAHHEFDFTPARGTRRPLHRTAAGVMLLTTVGTDQIRRMLHSYNATVPDGETPANVPETLRQVRIAASQGFFRSAGPITLAPGAIATLLSGLVRGQRLAIAIAAPMNRIARFHDRYLESLKATAAAI